MSEQRHVPEREARFTRLYEATYADLLRFIQRRVHPTQAEDVAADAFLVAWRRLDDLPDQTGDARAWLFGIARGVILNTVRGASRQRALRVRLAEAPTAAVAHLDTEVIAHQVDLAHAWRRLSDVHQEALALSVFEGLTAPQAARVLDISSVAFRLRLSKARRALRLHTGHLPPSLPTPANLPEGITS
ncbi:RNA polymerase sigma factor [Micromonospora halophytica]|uniref:RNA polymerase sigma-70 factor, ECF subfamily n=1 Tax=Micromonospora halophytica TaxID=47864 RepID=A0A1C5J7P3_9ACTN|nr:RNA polymerase sigma factor [Micromonospora halophytica]SCG66590.1 RNA polymerase sigma-70 factor, ECF subfamily [Micromonospora halophytica]